jgi:ABC-type branched-subunit amino acid transport system ATPase component
LSAEISGDSAILRGSDVSAGYAGRAVVQGVNFVANPKSVTSIVGPNGSGKSTLLKSLVGVVQILGGHVFKGETELTNKAPEDIARMGVGYVPQIDDIFPPLTVRENLEMGGYLLAAREIPARIEMVLSVFPRLESMLTRRAGKLSGGERKMLAMGRVMMLNPSVYILDEPTANLAPAIALSLLREQVRGLADRGSTVLIVEQRARAVLEISDHTYVLGGGRVLMEGSPSELSKSQEFVDSFLGGGAGVSK